MERQAAFFKNYGGHHLQFVSREERSPMTDFKSLAQLYNFIKGRHQSKNFVLGKKKKEAEK